MNEMVEKASGRSLGAMFLERVRLTPDGDAWLEPTDPGWRRWTWRQAEQVVTAWAAGLIDLGVRPQQRVGIASATRVEWLLADLAVMCAGAATTTVYATTPPDDVAFILADSDTRVVFAEDAAQLEKLRAVRDQVPSVRAVVMLTRPELADGDWVITTDDLARRGAARLQADPSLVARTVEAVQGEQLATLIYTSGTTGRPKGVRLTQANWVYEAHALDSLGMIHADDLLFLFIPLAHSFGKVLTSLLLRVGCTFAVDGRVETVQQNLADLRPTIFPAVPRIFEKVHAGLLTRMEREGGLRSRLFTWAMDVAARAGSARRRGVAPGRVLRLQHALADRLVLAKVREGMGGRMRFFVSAAAPLSLELTHWFDDVGLLVLQGYGLTETSAGCCLDRLDGYSFGTVGLPLPGTQVRIAEDGEVLVAGPCVMEGYHNRPEETAEVLVDGWLHTGDIGELVDGHLRITDRKKDLIKTSGGKYVAPQGIETVFKAICPYASNIVVHGDGRKYVSALVTLDPAAILGWAEQHGVPGDYEQVVGHPETVALVQRYVDEMNAMLPRWETVKRFAVLPRDLSIEAGELTPSYKVRRKVVEKEFADLFESLYR